MIAETGWPTQSMDAASGNDGAASPGGDASVANLQTFLDTFVCAANTVSCEEMATGDSELISGTYSRMNRMARNISCEFPDGIAHGFAIVQAEPTLLRAASKRLMNLGRRSTVEWSREHLFTLQRLAFAALFLMTTFLLALLADIGGCSPPKGF